MKKINLVLVAIIAMILTSCSQNNGEGPEGLGGEGGNESGMIWAIDQTANEVVNGIHLILTYNANANAFEGTMENTNTTTAPQVRVEVHVFDSANNSMEFGPTTPVDMPPGDIQNVSLPIAANTNFVSFNMHPEVGSSGSGG